MARHNDRDRERDPKRVSWGSRPGAHEKLCVFCADPAASVDYKDIHRLERFMSDRGRIRSRRVTGNCAQHQRDIEVAIKTAREVALLPYTPRTVSAPGPGRARAQGAEWPSPDARTADQEMSEDFDHDEEFRSSQRELVVA